MSELNDYLVKSLKGAEAILAMAMDGVNEEQLRAHPGGTANPISLLYAHAVIDEDMIMNAVAGRPSLWSEGWAGKLGGSAEMGTGRLDDLKGLDVDLDRFKPYAQAASERAAEIAAKLTSEDLARNMGPDFENQSVAEVISGYVLWHICFHTGEISSQKGVMGLQGLPF